MRVESGKPARAHIQTDEGPGAALACLSAVSFQHPQSHSASFRLHFSCLCYVVHRQRPQRQRGKRASMLARVVTDRGHREAPSETGGRSVLLLPRSLSRRRRRPLAADVRLGWQRGDGRGRTDGAGATDAQAAHNGRRPTNRGRGRPPVSTTAVPRRLRHPLG